MLHHIDREALGTRISCAHLVHIFKGSMYVHDHSGFSYRVHFIGSKVQFTTGTLRDSLHKLAYSHLQLSWESDHFVVRSKGFCCILDTWTVQWTDRRTRKITLTVVYILLHLHQESIILEEKANAGLTIIHHGIIIRVFPCVSQCGKGYRLNVNAANAAYGISLFPLTTSTGCENEF